MKEALILIDIQNDYFPNGALPIWRPVETAESCKVVLEHFRKHQKEVVHVKHHCVGPDAEKFKILLPGTHGAEIHELVKPLPEEKVVVKEHMNGFWETDLGAYLKSKKIERLVFVGMMIHNCVPATLFAGKDDGFECVVVDEAVNTMSQPLHGEMIQAEDIKKAYLAGIQFAYAKVKKVEEILNED